MGFIKETVSQHRLTGKISELKDYRDIISILKEKKYDIKKEDPVEIHFVLRRSEYSERYRDKIKEGSILYNHVSGDFEFIYPDKYAWSDLLAPALMFVFLACFSGLLIFIVPILLMVGVSRFSFLFYKNVIGREFISNLKLKADYP